MILCKGDDAAIIPDDEIQAIRRVVEGHFRVEPHPFLKCGERVRVKQGALAGVEGILSARRICIVWFFPWDDGAVRGSGDRRFGCGTREGAKRGWCVKTNGQ